MRVPSIVLLSAIVSGFFGSVGCVAGAAGSADRAVGEEEEAAQSSATYTGTLRTKAATGKCLGTFYEAGESLPSLFPLSCQSVPTCNAAVCESVPKWTLSETGVLYATDVPAETETMNVVDPGTDDGSEWLEQEILPATVCILLVSVFPRVPPLLELDVRPCVPAATKGAWSLQGNGEIRSVANPTMCLTMTTWDAGLALCNSSSTDDEWDVPTQEAQGHGFGRF